MSETLAAALEREHREIDKGIEQFLAASAAAPAATEALTTAVAALRKHIYVEEEYLFPALRAMGLMAPVFVMIREHGDIWRVLADLDPLLTDPERFADAAGLCRELMSVLEAHNFKEERILYPQTEQALAPEAREQALQILNAGTLPDGWQAEGLRSAI